MKAVQAIHFLLWVQGSCSENSQQLAASGRRGGEQTRSFQGLIQKQWPHPLWSHSTDQNFATWPHPVTTRPQNVVSSCGYVLCADLEKRLSVEKWQPLTLAIPQLTLSQSIPTEVRFLVKCSFAAAFQVLKDWKQSQLLSCKEQQNLFNPPICFTIWVKMFKQKWRRGRHLLGWQQSWCWHLWLVFQDCFHCCPCYCFRMFKNILWNDFFGGMRVEKGSNWKRGYVSNKGYSFQKKSRMYLIYFEVQV